MTQPRTEHLRGLSSFHGRHPAGLSHGRWGPLSSLLALLLLWQTRASQRSHLAELDPRLLADMGLTRKQAEAEAAKPFWRV